MSEDIEPHILERFEIVEKMGKGNYGIVWKAIYRKYKQVVAIKKIFDVFNNPTDAKRTLREVLYHQEFSDHENIIGLRNVIKSQNGRDLYLILDYMETDLHNVIRAKILMIDHIRFITTQLLRAVKYIHSGEVIHRDIKPANILVDANCHIKLIDFGLARSLKVENGTFPVLTEYVATRWYRAPEILLGSKFYSKAVDMWAVGCVLGEMLAGKPLFPGTSTLNQIERILDFTGMPSEEDIEAMGSPLASDVLSSLEIGKARTINSYFPSTPDGELELIKGLLEFNPKKRFNVDTALGHKFLGNYPQLLGGDDAPTKGTVIIPIDDNKKLSSREYRDALYAEIQKRKREIRKKIGKFAGSATSANSDQFLPSKSPSNNALPQDDKSPFNKSGQSTPNNIQSKMPFSPKQFGTNNVNSPISSNKSPQQQSTQLSQNTKGNFSTLATSTFGKTKQKSVVVPTTNSAFKKQMEKKSPSRTEN